MSKFDKDGGTVDILGMLEDLAKASEIIAEKGLSDDVVVNPKMTVWIKLGNTEIKRVLNSVIHLSEYMKIFDRDWTTLNTRNNEIPIPGQSPDDFRWFEVTIWFQGANATLQDSLETMDVKTARHFVRVVFEAWKRTQP